MPRERERPKTPDETREVALLDLGRVLDRLDVARDREKDLTMKDTWHRVTDQGDGTVGLWLEGTRRFLVAHTTDPEARRSLVTQAVDLRVLMQPPGEPQVVVMEAAVAAIERAAGDGMEKFWLEDDGSITPEKR